MYNPGTHTNCELMFLFALADVAGLLPIQTDFPVAWFGLDNHSSSANMKLVCGKMANADVKSR